MSNSEIVKLLRNVAASYSIKDEKKYRFQIIAYHKAAESIENLTSDVKLLIKEDGFDEIPGIGTSIKSYLLELIENGKVKHYDKLMSDIPPSVFALMDIPSLGPKKSYKLVSHFQLKNDLTVINDLLEIAEKGEIAKLPNFSES